MQQSLLVIYAAIISASAAVLANLISIWFATRNAKMQINQSIAHFDSQFDLNRKFETFRLLSSFAEKIRSSERAFHSLSRSGSLKTATTTDMMSLVGDFSEVRHLCNLYETLAVGIIGNIIDEDQVKDYWRSDYVRTWLRLKPVVELMRKEIHMPKLYIKFQEMAERWVNETDDIWLRNYLAEPSPDPTPSAEN